MKTMQFVVWTGFIVSILICIMIALRHSMKVKGIADIFPLILGRTAQVHDYREFSASTVAATISLATVVIAFYELAPFLGLWLLWPAITTAMGLWYFNALTGRVWKKMSTYTFRPTLHAYLGTEYNSKHLAFIASLFTVIGYLTAFAVELTVSAWFLGPLLPGVHPLIIVSIIAIISFVYTGLGGFRTVVVTDRLQMGFIWILLISTGAYYAVFLHENGVVNSFQKIPNELWNISWSQDRIPFILGILIMNLLTYVGNMGLWQRVAGAQNPETVSKGLWSSVRVSALSWSLFALAAVGAYMIVTPVPKQNLMITVLESMQSTTFGLTVIFCVVLGLMGAMLSTASTQLMAITHTIYEDLIAPFRRDELDKRIEGTREVWLSRSILTLSAVVSVAVVEGLRAIGFSVADMAFAVYGAALGLVPPILLSLYKPRETTNKLSKYATAAVALGFIGCWAAATYGRLHGDGNLVFLSPIVSTVIASLIMLVGYIQIAKANNK